MIHTARQLKALVRNLSGGDSTKAQILIRTYVMERFLERLSYSKNRNHLIVKDSKAKTKVKSTEQMFYFVCAFSNETGILILSS